mmetsp:Transcript_76849/g.159888  ORF Transcript_76849/g.159888 Transcript_76849/m.159888 type:complete len:252 (-) Transcript_76849:21-776(-)
MEALMDTQGGSTSSNALSAAERQALMAQALVMIAGNEECFDCSDPCSDDPWVSMNHATVICLHCAGQHRALGVHVSFVRSLKLDGLDKTKWKALQAGGNNRFRAFLEDPMVGIGQHVWRALSFKDRYHTPAADLYRRRLAAEQRGDPELPTDLRRPSASTSSSDRGAAGKRPAVTSPPAWTADSEARRCELCKANFTILFRRHHCRRCGRCICHDCSPSACWRPLPQLGVYDNCRQCKVCVPPAAKPIAGL